jgi:hypothetical protein
MAVTTTTTTTTEHPITYLPQPASATTAVWPSQHIQSAAGFIIASYNIWKPVMVAVYQATRQLRWRAKNDEQQCPAPSALPHTCIIAQNKASHD